MTKRSDGLALSGFTAGTAERPRRRRSCYEIEPGARLGWHTDATEETQYIIAGTGTLYMEDGSTYPVGPGSVFLLPTPVRNDLANTSTETLRSVAFFAAAMFTQNFDNVMLPPKSHILGTPNRDG